MWFIEFALCAASFLQWNGNVCYNSYFVTLAAERICSELLTILCLWGASAQIAQPLFRWP